MAITEWEVGRAAVGQKEIKIVLCDDDPTFLEELSTELTRIFAKRNIRVKIAAFHGPAGISEDALRTCDMAFLDIDFESDDRNGIDIARELREVNSRSLLFFVTNFIDYAPAGFEVHAFRYILKQDRDEVLERYILQAMETLAEGQEHLRLRDEDRIVDVPLSQIEYLEVKDHYVSVHAGASTYTLSSSLSNLENALEPHGFLRIHKSYLVNMALIRKFRSRECLMVSGTALAVGEKSYPQHKQKYLRWKGLK
ncbi:MAG: LytTR family DNA-binding domain-containing protein [Firmicutes bacterium]|nr:LytTR family DNA-binding domain-containing protein [Bacillota bacterium]